MTFFAGVLGGAALLFLACASSSGGGGGGTTGGSCAWHGNCSSTAPNGAYDCVADAELVQCVNGHWQHIAGCTETQNSGGYFCNCKGGCGMDSTACSYAFETCEGQSYETCGPNAHSVLTSQWVCQSN